MSEKLSQEELEGLLRLWMDLNVPVFQDGGDGGPGMVHLGDPESEIGWIPSMRLNVPVELKAPGVSYEISAVEFGAKIVTGCGQWRRRETGGWVWERD